MWWGDRILVYRLRRLGRYWHLSKVMGQHGITRCEGYRTSGAAADFGEPFIGSYLPSATNKVPEDDPSTNSTTGGRSLLKLSMSLAGLYCDTLSED